MVLCSINKFGIQKNVAKKSGLKKEKNWSKIMGRKGEVSDIKKCLEKKDNQPRIVNNFLKL